ncbi:hypothetical protein Lal_00029658 [Lupinus albus]|nr:hypothetical protein Lal_00029658 [Lupinus albus]
MISSNFMVPWSFLDGLETSAKKDTSIAKTTFAQAVKNTGDVSLAHLPQPCFKGDVVAVKISEAAYQAGLQRCRNNPHGRLILAKGDQPIKFAELKPKLIELWSLVGKWSMISLGRGFYEFAFSSTEDMRSICATSSWNIKPVGIGSPISPDAATTNRSFGHIARVLVDVNLKNSIPNQVLVERDEFEFLVGVEVENMPTFCSGCQEIDLDIENNEEVNTNGLERLVLHQEDNLSEAPNVVAARDMGIVGRLWAEEEEMSSEEEPFIEVHSKSQHKKLKKKVQGFGNAKTRLVLKNYCLENKPAMVFIVEPMIGFDEVNPLFWAALKLKGFGFNERGNSKPNLWGLCDTDLNPQVIGTSNQHITSAFEVSCSTLPRIDSDHHPLLLCFSLAATPRFSSFKFYKMWLSNVDCQRVVAEVWRMEVVGCPMFALSQKLKLLKNELKSWNTLALGNIHDRVKRAWASVDSIQGVINIMGHDEELLIQENLAQSLKSNLLALNNLIQEYAQASSQHINLAKCKFYTANVAARRISNLSAILGFNVGSMPFNYLGVPFFKGKPRRIHLQPIADRITVKLATWKGLSLSIMARVELVKSVIHSMLAYSFHIYAWPASLIKDIDGCIRNFIWFGDTKTRKIVTMTWKIVCSPVKAGGLGLRSRFDIGKSPGSRFFKSSIWCGIKANWSLVMQNYRWLVGVGDKVNFWRENWLGTALVAKVSDFMWNSTWTIPKVIVEAYPGVVEDIVQVNICRKQDKLIWQGTTDGTLSLKADFIS